VFNKLKVVNQNGVKNNLWKVWAVKSLNLKSL